MTRLSLAMLAGLLVVALSILAVLIRRTKASTSKIDLDDLLLGDDGKLSRSACVLLGSFLVSCWVIVNLLMTGKLTEGYFTIYCAAWVTPAVTKLIVGAK